MKMSELQRNILDQIRETLYFFSNTEDQISYKNAVPYVHIPIELLNQWSNNPRLINEKRKWFIEIFSSEQITGILDFETHVNDFNLEKGDDIEDIPKIHDDQHWIELGIKAKELLKELEQTPIEIKN